MGVRQLGWQLMAHWTWHTIAESRSIDWKAIQERAKQEVPFYEGMGKVKT